MRPLEIAALAIGLLDAELRRSPVKSIWHQRQHVATAVRATSVAKHLIDRDRLLALSIGLPVTITIDAGAARLALSVLRVSLGDHAALEFDSDLDADTNALVDDLIAAVPASGSRLLHLAEAAHEGVDPAFVLAVPRYLRHTGVTREVLAGVCGVPKRAPGDRGEWVVAFLERLRAEATEGLKRLVELELSWARWARLAGLERRRSDSHLAAALMLVAATGLASPAFVARRLRITETSATRLLDELVQCGVLVELTGRRNWRVFTTEDLCRVADVAQRRPRRRAVEEPASGAMVTPRGFPRLPPLPDIDFTAAIADVDVALRRIEERLRARIQEPDDPEGAQNQ